MTKLAKSTSNTLFLTLNKWTSNFEYSSTRFDPSLAFTSTFLYFSDGSTIYGSSKDEAEELRTFVKGQLRVQTDAVNEELLPADTNDLDCRMSNGFSCFKSGDVRVNEHPSLVGKQNWEYNTVWKNEKFTITKKDNSWNRLFSNNFFGKTLLSRKFSRRRCES